MKRKLFILALLMAFSAPMFAQQAPNNPLSHIQTRLANAPTLDSLLVMISALEHARATTPNAYLNYWEAYVLYRLTSFYEDGDGNQRKKAEGAVDKGIGLLEGIKAKTSEHYALLSLLQGEQLAFANVVTVAFKAPAVAASARKAIQMDPNNLRGYLALAIYDFNTPKLYGGGKLVEENLKKALSLPIKADPNPYAPDWGQASAYWHLVMFYKNEGQLSLAKQYALVGASKYPLNQALQTLNSKL